LTVDKFVNEKSRKFTPTWVKVFFCNFEQVSFDKIPKGLKLRLCLSMVQNKSYPKLLTLFKEVVAIGMSLNKYQTTMCPDTVR